MNLTNLKKINDLVIKRSEWLRGKGAGSSYLLAKGSERKQCCVGIWFTACGVPDPVIRNRQSHEALEDADLDKIITRRTVGVWFEKLYDAYHINDDEDVSEYKREMKIKKFFREELDIKVKFIA